MSIAARARLLEKYGFGKRWIRYDRPVRIVDARQFRGVTQLAWVHVDEDRFNGAVRWITERNFTRFYRETKETGA